jgi:hypothetical protein
MIAQIEITKQHNYVDTTTNAGAYNHDIYNQNIMQPPEVDKDPINRAAAIHAAASSGWHISLAARRTCVPLADILMPVYAARAAGPYDSIAVQQFGYTYIVQCS